MFDLEIQGHSEKVVLQEYAEFVADADEIWSHATYDFVCLNHAFSRHNLKGPSFRKSRDIRTINSLSTEAAVAESMLIPRQGLHHDALGDAIYQAQYVSYLLTKLPVFKG